MTDTEKAVREALVGVNAAFTRVLAEAPADAAHYSIGFDCEGSEIRIQLQDMRSIAAITALLSELDAVRAERDRMAIENVELRHVVSNCAAALVTGAFVSPKCSVEFMQGVPNEISSTVASLRDERDQQHTRVLQLQMLAWKWMEAHDKLKDGLPYDYPAVTDVPDVVAERDRLAGIVDRLKQEAQIHSMEARGANSTIAEIYQIISGGRGEPGNWNGAEPVRKYVEAVEAERDRLREALEQIVAINQVREFMGNDKSDGYGDEGWVVRDGQYAKIARAALSPALEINHEQG